MAVTLQNNNVNVDQSDQFNITVSNTASKSAKLTIKPTGELQSNGKNIVRSVNGINADVNGNINIAVNTNGKFLFFSSDLVTYSNWQTTKVIDKNIVVQTYKSARDWGRTFTFPNGKVAAFAHITGPGVGAFIPKGTKWTVNKEEDTLTGHEVIQLVDFAL